MQPLRYPFAAAADVQAGRTAGSKAGGKGTPAMPTVKLLDLGMACLYDPAKPQRGARMAHAAGAGAGVVQCCTLRALHLQCCSLCLSATSLAGMSCSPANPAA